jgi:alkyl hydroperoxide reductase subunit AhpF
VLLAYRCAKAHPRIRAEGVEASEFPARADQHGVFSVPAVVVNGRAAWAGNVPEQAFVERLLEAAARA